MILTGNKITEEILNGKIVIEPFDPAAVTTNSYDLTLGDKLVMYTDEVLDPKKEPHIRTFEIPDEGYEMKRGESRRSRFGRPRAKSGFITASTRTTRDRWPRAFTKISNKGYFSSTKVTGPSLISPTAMSA